LLYSLTNTFFNARVTTHSAHIATYGERATDTFYITDLTGEKIDNGPRLKALEKRLLDVASGAVERAETVQAAQ
jgi:[protein-PII] uridylyltransferase